MGNDGGELRCEGGCLPGTKRQEGEGSGSAGPRDHSSWEPGPQGVPSLVALLDTGLSGPVVALWPGSPREEEGPVSRVVGA